MIDTRLPCFCRDTHGESCRKCSPKPYTPIVPGPAPDDGRGRRSAYDTTWPDVHARSNAK